jgi:tetratricopeptide (TPR) repeat protein/tRNA A-37 threonylcarbamoyl transferase component Bud32
MSLLSSNQDSRELRVNEIIASYLEAVERGESPDQQAYLARYPELASDLSLFFADLGKFHKAAGDLPHSEPTIIYGQPVDSGSASTVSYRPVVPRVRSDRYQLKRCHARGGMGEVWSAIDREIGRQVAFKVIRPGHEQQSERFFAEAQITGQLEHPSIVPVHDLGVDEKGKPFYVMKFVQGRTLQAVIEDYHAADNRSTAPREVQQLRLLEIYVALCQTVAYAHSRGVIHRDLKPDNVMVGSYGETLVLDWGLAKVLHQEEVPGSVESDHVHLTHSGTSSETLDGEVIGALPYMAPEVADGKSDQADERTDVYLLGGTLYQILTGSPPRRGSSRAEMLELARSVPVAPPRQARRDVPRPLEAICLKAMARRPQDRYATPMALADDVQRYLAAEAVSAYRESWLRRTWRWSRRHRKMLTRLAAALAVSVAAYATVALVRDAENRRLVAEQVASEATAREQARGDVDAFRELADESRYLAASNNPIAERVPYYDPQQGWVHMERALDLAKKWGPKLDDLVLEDERASLRDDLYDLLLLEVQIRLHGSNTPSVGEQDAPGELLGLLDWAAQLRESTRVYHQLRAACLRRAGKNEEAATEDVLATDERTPLAAIDHFLAGEALRSIAVQRLGAEEDPADADRAKRLGLVRRLPVGASATGANVFAMPDLELLQQAAAGYRRALEIDPKHYWSHFQLGRCYLSLGRAAEAAAALGACVALRPDALWSYSARGLALALAGRYDEAEADLDRAIELDPKFRPARMNRGFVQWSRGQHAAALEDFAAAMEKPAEKQLIEAAFYRGQLYLQQGNSPEALAHFDLLAEERPRFFAVHLLRAQAHLAQGQSPAALDDLNRFLAQDTAFDPESGAACQRRGHYLRRLATHLPLAAVKAARELAISQFLQAEALGEKTAELFQELGAAQMAQGRADAAVEAYTRGLELAPADFKLLKGRGFALRDLARYEQAETDLAAALRVKPNDSEAHSMLGCVYARMGRVEAARREADVALLGGSGDYMVLHNVACIHAILSDAAPEASSASEYQNLALAILQREVALWGGLVLANIRVRNALALIAKDTDFGPALRARPEFQQLLAAPANTPPAP